MLLLMQRSHKKTNKIIRTIHVFSHPICCASPTCLGVAQTIHTSGRRWNSHKLLWLINSVRRIALRSCELCYSNGFEDFINQDGKIMYAPRHWHENARRERNTSPACPTLSIWGVVLYTLKPSSICRETHSYTQHKATQFQYFVYCEIHQTLVPSLQNCLVVL